jgi:GAF domain-containing protein
MLRLVKAFFRPPVFPDDEDKTRKAVYAHMVSLLFAVAPVLYELWLRITRPELGIGLPDFVMFALAIVGVVSWWLVRRGQVAIASVMLVILIWAGTNGIAASGYGIRDASYITNFLIMLFGALLLGWQAALFIAVASMGTAYWLANAEASGALVIPNYPVTSFARDISILMGITAFLIYILTDGLEKAVRRSRNSFRALATANIELNETQTDLHARTEQLASANAILQKRTERLRAIAEVARTAASVQSFDSLLPLISSIISQQLSYYLVRIFLVDQQNEFAILRSQAVNGNSGMPAEAQRIPMTGDDVVSTVARTGMPRIAMDTVHDKTAAGESSVQGALGELALPLKVSGRVIGVLDLHSLEAGAFEEEEVSNLTILADQVAISIQNALSSEQVQHALRDAEIASRQATGQVWQKYSENLQRLGYRYDGIKSEALKEKDDSKSEDDFFVPVQLRGQTIGRLRLKTHVSSRAWTSDELAIIEATAERVALALEGARLLEDAQKRASRETFLSEMAAKLSTSFQLDSILRDTVEELGQSLTGSTVSFQLVNPSVPLSVESNNGSHKTTDSERGNHDE